MELIPVEFMWDDDFDDDDDGPVSRPPWVTWRLPDGSLAPPVQLAEKSRERLADGRWSIRYA